MGALFALARVPLLLLDNYLYSVLQATGQVSRSTTPPAHQRKAAPGAVGIFVMWLNMGLPAAVVTYTLIGFVNMGWLMPR